MEGPGGSSPAPNAGGFLPLPPPIGGLPAAVGVPSRGGV